MGDLNSIIKDYQQGRISQFDFIIDIASAVNMAKETPFHMAKLFAMHLVS